MRILLAGLVDAGKTTFLAALWHQLCDEGSERRLRIGRLTAEDRTYLNEIEQRWLRCQRTDRTPSSAVPEVVTLGLVDDDGNELEIVVPDLAGEHFRAAVEERQWPSELSAYLEADAVLLFVHPDGNFRSATTEEVNELGAATGDAPIGSGSEPPDAVSVPFDASVVDDSIRLVEIIQLLCPIRSNDRPGFRLGVVVSAWDRVPSLMGNPRTFVDAASPLLAQFLESCRREFAVSLWGVSAQGGDYESDVSRLAKTPRASDRAIVVGEAGHQGADLTEPLCWLVGISDQGRP